MSMIRWGIRSQVCALIYLKYSPNRLQQNVLRYTTSRWYDKLLSHQNRLREKKWVDIPKVHRCSWIVLDPFATKYKHRLFCFYDRKWRSQFLLENDFLFHKQTNPTLFLLKMLFFISNKIWVAFQLTVCWAHRIQNKCTIFMTRNPVVWKNSIRFYWLFRVFENMYVDSSSL